MTITMFLLLASFSNMTVPTLLPQVTAFSTFHRVTGHLHAGRKSHKRVRANEQVQILMKATSNNRVEDHCTNTIDGNTVNTNIGKSNNLENSTSTNIEISTNEEIAINMSGPNNNAQLYTTVILKIAYDGTHFRGWTAGKHSMMAKEKKNDAKNKSGNKGNSDRQPNKRRQSRRSRTLQRKGGYLNKNNGEVRSVERTLRVVLAKIYGNIQPNQIVLDACSRTDAGVHATCLIAQLYCYANNTTNFFANEDDNVNTTSIPNTPTIPLRPTSRNDTAFLPLPFDSNLSKLVFVLNRMLPPDVRVAAAAPLPRVPLSTPMKPQSNIADNINDSIYSIREKNGVAFHPTLHTSCKTYIYKFAIGHIHDPMRSQYVWQ